MTNRVFNLIDLIADFIIVVCASMVSLCLRLSLDLAVRALAHRVVSHSLIRSRLSLALSHCSRLHAFRCPFSQRARFPRFNQRRE